MNSGWLPNDNDFVSLKGLKDEFDKCIKINCELIIVNNY